MTQQSYELDKNFSELEQLWLRDAEIPEDLDELEALLAGDGFDLSSPDYQRSLQDRLAPIRERIEDQRSNQRQRPQFYSKIRNMALTARDSVALIFAFMLMALVPFFGIIMLFLSETFSAGLGATTFLHQGFEVVVAWVLAITLTAFFFSLEWRYAALLHKYGKPKAYRMTIGIYWQRIVYFLNPKAELLEREDSHDLRETRATARWTMMLIIVLGVLGRLFDELAEFEQDTWYEGFFKILTESNPQQFLEYLGGALIAFVLLIGTRYILGMIYEQWVAVGGEEESFFDSSSVREELRQVHVKFLQSIIRKRYGYKKGKLIPKYEAFLKEQEETQAGVEGADTNSETEASEADTPLEQNDQ